MFMCIQSLFCVSSGVFIWPANLWCWEIRDSWFSCVYLVSDCVSSEVHTQVSYLLCVCHLAKNYYGSLVPTRDAERLPSWNWLSQQGEWPSHYCKRLSSKESFKAWCYRSMLWSGWGVYTGNTCVPLKVDLWMIVVGSSLTKMTSSLATCVKTSSIPTGGTPFNFTTSCFASL